MGYDFLNSALNKVAISREDNGTIGVPSKDFTGTDSAFYFEQELDSPLSSTDNPEITVKKSTRARQIQAQADVMRGNNIVGVNFSNNVSKNDFATLFMPLFFQHSYAYTPTVTDGTITAVSSVDDTVTLTVTNIGTLAEGDYIVITGRTVTAENGTYEVSNISSNSFDITYSGGFDTEVAGTVTAELNTHESVFEDLTDPSKRRIESSFTFYQPYYWDKSNNAIGDGEIMTGLAAKTGSLNFVDSTYTIDMVGREIDNDSTNLPKEANDYKEPINETGTYFDMNNPVIKDVDGNVQDCLSLEMTITLNTETSQKVYKAGKYNRVVVDGAEIKGSYSLLFKTEDEATNHSKKIYDNRKSVSNNGVYSFGLSSNDGSYFEITSNVMFSNVQINKVSGGWELSTDYELLYDYDSIPISVKCVNGIAQSLAELFATTA